MHILQYLGLAITTLIYCRTHEKIFSELCIVITLFLQTEIYLELNQSENVIKIHIWFELTRNGEYFSVCTKNTRLCSPTPKKYCITYYYGIKKFDRLKKKLHYNIARNFVMNETFNLIIEWHYRTLKPLKINVKTFEKYISHSQYFSLLTRIAIFKL